MAKPAATPAIVRISTNTIIGNRFFNAYEPLPVERADDLPENLRPLVVTDEPDQEPDDEPRGGFQLNTPYRVTDDGRLGRIHKRRVERQIAELAATAQENEWLEEAASQPLPEEIVRDLEDAHQSDVARQAAQAAATARISDDAADAAIAASEPVRRFVRRGSRHYVEIHRTKLRPSEAVFTKDADGAYEFIGETDSKAQPPDPPTIIT
jgi:hypothetical protein